VTQGFLAEHYAPQNISRLFDRFATETLGVLILSLPSEHHYLSRHLKLYEEFSISIFSEAQACNHKYENS